MFSVYRSRQFISPLHLVQLLLWVELKKVEAHRQNHIANQKGNEVGLQVDSQVGNVQVVAVWI